MPVGNRSPGKATAADVYSEELRAAVPRVSAKEFGRYERTAGVQKPTAREEQ